MSKGWHRLREIAKVWGAWAPWGMVVLAGVLFALVACCVDLKPQVDEYFFFSTSDPLFRQARQVNERFPAQAQMILSVSAHDISSKPYLHKIRQLTRAVRSIESVANVRSLTAGPKNFADAQASPFWRRLLIAEDEKSSNLIVLIEGRETGKLVESLENTIKQFDAPDFQIHMAGTPYVVEMIRRSLVHDFLYFSITAVMLFGLTMTAIFRSVRVFTGMLTACASAVLLTLIAQALLGKKIGILTVNLGTIVFVIALSHLVYMTFNWQTLAGHAGKKSLNLAWEAVRVTFPASFWSMVCSSLGFGSLLFVGAKPLRELGFGGVLGTVLALGCAYTMYPWFLQWAVPRQSKLVKKDPGQAFWSRRYLVPSAIVVLVSLGLGFGLTRLNTDPSLLDYFKARQPLRDGLEYVDRNGGSNPLMLVVEAENGGKLNTAAAYQRLWDLQRTLEQQPGVGAVISLPTLLAEGNRHPLAFLLTWENMLRIMEQPQHQRIARSFISNDRREAVFLLRMVETGRQKPHTAIVDDLRTVIRQEGFETVLVGGIYSLQGELAKLVQSSLVEGLFWLNVLFIVIAWIVARSVRGTVAMIVSLTLVPLCMLGGIGLLRVPVDVISAPATNVCIGIAIDSMIHLMFALRRNQRAGRKGWAAWVAAREEQWRGIVYSDVIIAAGFAIFALSNFPPTQRFGLVVVVGTVVDILANLFVLPLLGGAEQHR